MCVACGAAAGCAERHSDVANRSHVCLVFQLTFHKRTRASMILFLLLALNALGGELDGSGSQTSKSVCGNRRFVAQI